MGCRQTCLPRLLISFASCASGLWRHTALDTRALGPLHACLIGTIFCVRTAPAATAADHASSLRWRQQEEGHPIGTRKCELGSFSHPI